MNSEPTLPDTHAGHNGKTISFSGKFTGENAQDIRAELLKGIDDSRELRLDLSAVSEIDLVGMQIICSLHRTAQERGISIQLPFPPPDLAVRFAREAGFPRHASCLKGVNDCCIWNEHI